MSSEFDHLIAQLNIEMLPRNAQEEIIARLGETILRATLVTIVERLSWLKRRKFGL